MCMQGRSLFDVVVYSHSVDGLYLDCDRSMAPALMKHLSLFKLRSKVCLVLILVAIDTMEAIVAKAVIFVF